MVLSHVRHRVQALAHAAPDYEAQHGLEHALFADVLASIAVTSSGSDAKVLAAGERAAKTFDFLSGARDDETLGQEFGRVAPP